MFGNPASHQGAKAKFPRRGGRGLHFARGAMVALIAFALGACDGAVTDLSLADADNLTITLVSAAPEGQLSGVVGGPTDDRVRVRVSDTRGRPVEGVSVEFRVLANDGAITPTYVRSNAQGMAEADWTLGSQAGTHALEVVGTVDYRESFRRIVARLFARALPSEPETVQVSPTLASVEVGAKRAFQAQVRDQYGNTVSDADLTWRVANASVASISSAGEVLGLAAGSTEVEVLAAGGSLRATAALTVAAAEVEVPKLPVPPTVTDLRVKSVTHNSVVLSFTEVSDGTGAPASYSIRYGSPGFSVSWDSRASTEISVDGSNVGGTIDLPYTGLSAATDYAFRVVAVRNSLDGTSVRGEVSSAVAARTGPAPVGSGNDHSLTISPGSLELTGIGATAQLSAKLTNGSGQEVQGATLSWGSSNTRVATVSTGGRVTARGAGVALLTVAAACCGATDTISVIVYETPSATSGWEGTWQTNSNGQVSTLVVDKSTVMVPQISLVTQATIQGETLKAGPASSVAGVVALDLRLNNDRFSGTVSVDGAAMPVEGVRQVNYSPPPGPEPTDPGVPSEPRSPPPPSGNGTPVFSDGFESGNTSRSQNGYRWAEVSGSPDHRVADRAPVAFGDYAHRFRQGNTQVNRLMRIQGPGLTEVWLEYWIRIPDQYSQTGTGSLNNKWMEMFNDKRETGDKGGLVMFVQTRPNAANDGGSRLRYSAAGGTGSGSLTSETTVAENWITLADRGQWVRYGYRLRLSSAPNVNDGIFEAWKNGEMVGSLRNLPLYAINAGNYLHEIINFQIMGWNNSTFSPEVTWYVDEVKLYGENPGW